MSVKPYPAGTQVVITWNGGSDKPRLGEVHTVGEGTVKPGALCVNPNGKEGTALHLAQELTTCKPTYGARFLHPVEWMKPFEDPDKDGTITEKWKRFTRQPHEFF